MSKEIVKRKPFLGSALAVALTCSTHLCGQGAGVQHRGSKNDPDWATICETPGKYRAVTSVLYLEARHFTTSYLTRFFSAYLTYGDWVEIDLVVVSDRRFIDREPEVAEAFPFDHPPDVEPAKVTGPIALFRKIGPAASFEFRNSKGQIKRVALQGPDVFSPLVEGLRPVVVGYHFSSHASTNPTSDCLADTVRHIVLVLPQLKELSPEQISSVCRFYAHHLGLLSFSMHIYGSFQEAGGERRFDFPALEAMAGGFMTPRKAERRVLFGAYEGRGSLVMIEGDRPIWRSQIE